MSERYEAVIVVSTKEALHRAVIRSRIDTPLESGELTSTVLALFPSKPRRIIDDALMPHIAYKISRDLGKALAVLYDNQIGWRSAYLYESGTFIKEYTEEDELWVLLLEDGTPQSNGITFRIQELSEDQEYDCLVSAIDAGLRAMGIDGDLSSQDIKQALCYTFYTTLKR